MMQLSETVKVYPTEYQKILITQTMTEYINTVNGLVSDAVSGHSIAKTTTADIIADLPSALVNQCIRDKEQRIMCDTDHKLSHDIVETAVAHNVNVIKLEQLSNIRSALRGLMAQP